MGNRKERLILDIVATDRTFDRVAMRGGEAWAGKCIHCNAHLYFALSGAPVNGGTIEHIVARTHGGTDALENLSLACRRCNNQKGVRHDTRRGDDPRMLEIRERLLEKRRKRWRDPD